MFLTELLSPWFLLLVPVLYYVLPYLQFASIRDVPGPFLARFSNMWLLLQCRQGHRYKSVDEAHQKYGKFVRIQPNHVSIADPEAIQQVYGHGNGFLKSEYYDVFVSIQRGLFNTRDRNEHTRKRKAVSHTFSAKSVGQFEQYIHHNLDLLVERWTDLSKTAKDAGNQYAEIDALHWMNYLAFDVIGDLAFGKPFGMLEKGADITEVRMTPDAPLTYAPAVEVLNRRGEVNGTLGCYPQLKPYAKYLPDRFFRDGLQAVQNLAGIAVARVGDRLQQIEEGGQSDRVDLLARLMEGKDESGNKLGRSELTAEALTQLIAGSDTTSNTSCALIFWVMSTPGIAQKLQKELDAAIRGSGVPNFEQVKDLPYLNQVIQETLRIHSTSSLGLPRLIPLGTQPVTIAGREFQPGTVLSVPAYTIHHSKEVWGADADSFNPDRWAPNRITEKQKNAFIPFSYGPRACVGRKYYSLPY
jgi:benzoate 4-monooxygenase